MEEQREQKVVAFSGKLLLTPIEAAALLGIKRAKLYQLIMTKEVFSVKIGGARRLPRQALEEYVERLCSSQTAG